MPPTKSIICFFVILAPCFVLGIQKEKNASCASDFRSIGGQSLFPFHYEGNASDSFSPAKNLLVDLASDNYHTIDKLQSTITQSIRSTTKKKKEDRRKLARADSKTKIKKAHVKIVVYDKIKGYLNWMQDWFIQAARERCSTVCTVTEDKNEVSHVLRQLNKWPAC